MIFLVKLQVVSALTLQKLFHVTHLGEDDFEALLPIDAEGIHCLSEDSKKQVLGREASDGERRAQSLHVEHKERIVIFEGGR